MNLADSIGEAAIPGPPDLRGRGVRVGIIDSGVNENHPHVGGRLECSMAVEGGEQEGRRGAPERGVTGGNAPSIIAEEAGDVAGHGTAIAGLVVCGAPEVRLYSVRILDRRLRSYHHRLEAALRWCIEQRLDVVNLSLGTTDPLAASRLETVCREAVDAGLLLVAAAGPWGAKSHPAGFGRLVLGVASDPECMGWSVRYDPHDAIPFKASGYARPAEGHSGRPNFRGDSFAAARVSALAARVREWRPGLPLDGARDALENWIQAGKRNAALKRLPNREKVAEQDPQK